MRSGNLSLAVLIHGQKGSMEAREYVSPQDRHTYIEGREGSNFTLRIRNGSSRRVLAVISVDGLSVLDGKPAGIKSGGFILDPYGSIEVPGWMLNSQEAAKFFFAGRTEKGDASYVAQIGGDTANKGVIGVIFLGEVPSIPDIRDFRERSVMFSAPRGSVLRASAASASPSSPDMQVGAQSLGAGFGEASEFRTRQGDFRRGSEMVRILLHYDDARGLKRRGIDVSKPLAQPSAFPADERGCTPPPGWGS